MSPIEIRLLLHAYALCFPFSDQEQPFAQPLLDAGLIEKREGCLYWTCTKKGAAHVHQICALPFPTQVWIGSDGKAIDV